MGAHHSAQATDEDGTVAACVSELPFKLVREPFVVIVKECNPRAVGICDADITRPCRRKRLGIDDHPQPRVADRCKSGDCIRIRAIDDDDDLYGAVGLIEHALERPRQQLRPLAAWV